MLALLSIHDISLSSSSYSTRRLAVSWNDVLPVLPISTFGTYCGMCQQEATQEEKYKIFSERKHNTKKTKLQKNIEP
jgi:hypothetical protein